jgi:hypothetical protein
VALIGATVPTLLDIAKANGNDTVVGLIDETVRAHPEINLGFARTIKGLNYRTLIRTALPTVGFRNANEGSTPSKSAYENRTVETFILNPRIEADKAVADRYEDGAEAYLALEGAAQMEASMIAMGTQFYYGALSIGDAKGHPGLIDAYDATNMVVDAGGTTASTGSSVWAVKFGPKNVGWVFGNGGELSVSDPRIESILDATGKKYTGYIQEILAYPGLQVGNLQAVGRIKKLTADVGKGLTDALLGSLMAKFPVGIVPDVLLMTRRSLEQLRASRTAVNITGAPAPTPTEYQGIPIAATDSILNTESLTL